MKDPLSFELKAGLAYLVLISIGIVAIITTIAMRATNGGVATLGHCSQPAGLAYLASLENEPERWSASRAYLQLDGHNEIWIANEAYGMTSTRNISLSAPCRVAIWQRSKPFVEARDQQQISLK